MRQVLVRKTRLRLLGSVMLAGLVSACSSDVARFGDNPFSSPFSSRTAFDPVSTNSINRAKSQTDKLQPQSRLNAVPTSSAITQAIPAPSQPMLRQGTSALTTGSVATSNYPALSKITANNPPVTGSTTGWTAVGGTPVTMGAGENVNTLSSRYGVPASAILAVNGLSSANSAQPGQQLMIPAYNAASGGVPAAKSVARVAALPAASSMVSTPMIPSTPVIPTRSSVSEQAKTSLTNQLPAKPSLPTMKAPVRDVTSRVESDAEKRAAAKLAQLRKTEAEDEEEDEKPAKLSKTDTLKKAEDARKLADAKKQAELKKLEEAKKLAAAQKLADTKKTEAAKKAAALKLAQAKKAADEEDDEETTASIPEAKTPAKPTPKPVEKTATAVEEPADDKTSGTTFRWPAQGRVISGFGTRGTGGANDGINIALPEGTPVRAAEGGTVVHADDALKGYGKLVLVRHANGYVSVYAHNGEINVKRGESVKRGQVIAKSGQSGNVTSPQLHFEIRKGATPVDPNKYLASN